MVYFVDVIMRTHTNRRKICFWVSRSLCIGWTGLLLLAIMQANIGRAEALSPPSSRRSANIDSSESVLFLDNGSASLSHLISSPERYAAALNMTIEEIEQTKTVHERASEALHRKLSMEDLPGRQKHTLLCRHRLDFGRHPFTCHRCWSYLPVCVCSLLRTDKISLPKNMSVVVWTHHREWGLTSNTGGLLGLLLQDCHVLMKGLPDHDSQFDDFVHDPDNLVLVLWPDQNAQQWTDDETRSTTRSRYMALEQVRNKSRDYKHIVLVAVDGTWRNARRMVARLPRRENIFHTDLAEDIVATILKDSNSSEPVVDPKNVGISRSLLAPLRGRGPNIGENQVCTAEAVTAALLQLGIDENDAREIISVARQKVDLVCRYRAKVPNTQRGP